ncbi:MAG: radical SAM protein [Candidatus Tectomicrobia bacterium]|nr:radical SAM protein [Candidatus Tectomicrobia bacterium]
MRVLFALSMINCRAKYHHGLGFLSAVLKEAGHETALLELYDLDWSHVDETIKAFQPDLFAATAESHQVVYIKRLFDHVSATYPHVPCILGGVHVTMVPNQIFQFPKLLGVCVGEAEGPLLELVTRMEAGKDFYDIPNFTFRRNGETISNPYSYYVQNLDTVPYSDRRMFKRFRDAKRGVPLRWHPRFIFSRGCPYDCSYCGCTGLRAVFPNKKEYVRAPSPTWCIGQVERDLQEYTFDTFVIDDDLFTINKKWLLELANHYPEHLKRVNFMVNGRVETIDREVLEALKDMGCSLIQVGVETGDEDLRTHILKRRMKDRQIIEVFELARKVGIPMHSFNMVGVPGETRETMRKTLAFNRRIKPARAQISIFYPYRGTALGDECFEKKLVTGHYDNYFAHSVIKNDLLSEAEIVRFVKYFHVRLYACYAPGLAWRALKDVVRRSATYSRVRAAWRALATTVRHPAYAWAAVVKERNPRLLYSRSVR